MRLRCTVKHITNILDMKSPSYVDGETDPTTDLLIVQSADNAWRARCEVLLSELRRGLDLAK